MNYKDYIEAVYRIVEALEYLQGDLKTNLNNQLMEILEQAYQDTSVPTFKIFLELKREFPEITYPYSSKTCLTKQKTKLRMNKSYNSQEDCPFHVSPTEPLRMDNDETKPFGRGRVNISRRIYGRASNDSFSLGDTISLTFDNHKRYDEVEMQELIQHLRSVRQ